MAAPDLLEFRRDSPRSPARGKQGGLFTMARLEGKVAVITGAASGMGRATAVRFAGEGAAVVIADLNEDGGAAAVRGGKENGGPPVCQKTDVTSEAGVKAMVDRAVKEFGRLDITFNNAGLPGALGSIEQT